jgi:hypothetical protein
MSHTELGLDLFRTRGRAAVPLSAEFVRELEAVDLELLSAEKGSSAPALKRISERHHALARALAGGMSKSEAALVCNYDISRISILLADPSFQELMAFYKIEKDRAFRSVQDKMAGINSDALDILQDRIEDEPDKLSVGQILQIITITSDRTGNGPSSTQTVNVNEGMANRLEEARKRVAARRNKIIEGRDETNTQD